MPSTYSLDLRTRVLNDCPAGLTCTNVARKYSVSRIWVHNLKKQYQETGSIEPKKYKRGRKRKLEPYEQEVRQLTLVPIGRQCTFVSFSLRQHAHFHLSPLLRPISIAGVNRCPIGTKHHLALRVLKVFSRQVIVFLLHLHLIGNGEVTDGSIRKRNTAEFSNILFGNTIRK